MTGCIIENGGVDWIDIFNCINDFTNYNFLISDMECYPNNKETAELFKKEYCWLDGEKLLQIFEEEFQCIWGVISAFDKNINLEDILNYDLPCSDGYTVYWVNPFKMQHPLAKFEIAAWDGVLSIFISDNKKYVDEVKDKIKNVKDLKEYNKK